PRCQTAGWRRSPECWWSRPRWPSTPAGRRPPAPRHRESGKTGSLLGALPPWLVILRLIDDGFVPLGFLHDATAFRHLGSVIGASDLVVEQLGPRVPHQADQLRCRGEQPILRVQLGDARGDRPEQIAKVPRPVVSVDLIVLVHLCLGPGP